MLDKVDFKHQQDKEGTYTMKKDKILGIQELAGTDLWEPIVSIDFQLRGL